MKKNFSGLLSICIQHEIDHLDGILFIDHLSSLKRRMALQKMKKLKNKKKIKTDVRFVGSENRFFGTPEFSVNFLDFLHENKAEISFIVSQPAAYSGRGKKLKVSPTHQWAEKNKKRFLHPTI